MTKMIWINAVWMLFHLLFVKVTKPLPECPIHLCKCHTTTTDCSNHGKALQYIPEVPLQTEILFFRHNWIPNVTQEILHNISSLNLKEFIFIGNNVRQISKHAFEIFPNLTLLDLSGNTLSVLALQRSFYGLRNVPLKTLYLTKMKLNYLPENMFEYLQNTSVEHIELSENYFTFLDGKIFKYLHSLKHLRVDNNKINRIELDGMETLHMLTLKGNRLSEIPEFCNEKNVSYVPVLKEIVLEENRLYNILPIQFTANCLPNLQNLTLDKNQIINIPNNAFSDLPRLTKLSLNWLKENWITFSKYAFNSSSLKYLHIANHINDFFKGGGRKKLFTNCPNLRILDMTRIRLTSTSENYVQDMLSPLTKLEKLILHSTKLYYVPSNLFQKMPNLINLNLQSCLVNGWSPKSFVNMKSLKKLYLNHNEITLINETSFPASLLQQLERLDLGDNRLICNCDALWFQQWANKNRKKLPNYPKGYWCKSPAKWRNKYLEQYNPSYRTCHPISPYVMLGVGIGTAVVILSLIGATFYHYRWHLKHYVYLLRARRGYQKIPEGEDYIYDAFVAYTSDDLVWIMSQLIPHVEKKENQKLCLHDRDFLPGRFIVDNIQESIERSRKVILVLSNNFAKSHWCKVEIAMAQMRHINKGGNHIIVIMLEEIKSKYMNASLHLLLKSTTYIQWTDDIVGRDLFWKKLSTAIKG